MPVSPLLLQPNPPTRYLTPLKMSLAGKMLNRRQPLFSRLSLLDLNVRLRKTQLASIYLKILWISVDGGFARSGVV